MNKRKFLLFFVISTFFFSCNSSNQDSKTLRFWHFWSEPSQKKALKTLVERFEKENSCKVILTDLSWNDGKTKLMAAFNSETAPDVLELGSDWIAQFSSAGVLRNLSSDSVNLSRFAPFCIPPTLFEGNSYALPWTTDTRVMFFNKDLLKRAGLSETPPVNTDELLTACEKIQKLGDVYGFGANGSDAHRLYKKILPFIWSEGGSVISSDGTPTLNLAQNISAVETYCKLAKQGFTETQRQLDDAFLRGKIGFWFSGAWLLDKIKKENPALNYGVELIPAMPNGESSSFAGGEYLAINTKSKNSALALKFLLFITEGKNELEFCKAVNQLPADKYFLNDKYFDSIPHRSVFTRQLLSAKMTPAHPRWLDIEAILENAVVEAMYEKKTAKQALDDAQAKAAELAEE